MASIFDTPVDRDQQNATQLLELVKWASGLRGLQQLGRSYSGPIASAYNQTLGSPAFGPGGAVQGATQNLPPIGPLAIARGAGALPGVLRSGGTGLGQTKSAGVFGGDIFDQLLSKISRAGGSIAKKSQDVPDITQTGQAAAAKLIQGPGGTGKDALYKARTAMKNWTGGPGGMGSGIRKGDRELVDKAVTKLGDVGSDKLAAELNRMNPQGKWTINKVQQTRGGRSVARLDNPDDPTASGLQSLDQLQPDRAAELKQQLEGMTKAVRRDAEALINGEMSPNELDPKRLQRVRQAMSGEPVRKGSDWYDRAVAQQKRLAEEKARLRPISGGAPTPEDAPVEFPTSQFRPELRSGVGRQFGQEGPTAFKDMLSPVTSTGSGMLNAGRGPALRELPQQISTMERTMAETGGGNQLGPQTTMGSQNPVQDMMAWDKLRAMFKNIGMFQGRN